MPFQTPWDYSPAATLHTFGAEIVGKSYEACDCLSASRREHSTSMSEEEWNCVSRAVDKSNNCQNGCIDCVSRAMSQVERELHACTFSKDQLTRRSKSEHSLCTYA